MAYQIQVASSAADREAIFRFRYQVYIAEMQKAHVVADHENQMLYDDADHYMVLYYANSSTGLAATVRSQRGQEGPFIEDEIAYYGIDEFETFIQHKSIAIVDRLIVDQPFRRTSLAHEMMLRTYVDGWAAGTRLCFITCDDFLLPMYIRYGFRIYREPALLKSGERRHRLLLFLCDKTHLEKVRSPFLKHLPDELDDHGHYASLVEKNLDLELQFEGNYVK